METALLTVVKHWLSLGGGYVIAIVFIILFLMERKRCNELEKRYQESTDKVYDRMFDMSNEQTRVMTEVSAVLKDNDKTLDNVSATLQIMASRGL